MLRINSKMSFFMGDSTGGGLLLALVLKMKQEGIALLSQLIIYRPG